MLYKTVKKAVKKCLKSMRKQFQEFLKLAVDFLSILGDNAGTGKAPQPLEKGVSG